MRYKHKEFSSFYPSDVFDFGSRKYEIQKLEENIRSYSDLVKLKKLYKDVMPTSLNHEELIAECEYSKRILTISIDEIKNLSENSQHVVPEVVSLDSLIVSIIALVISASGEAKSSIFFSIFSLIVIVSVVSINTVSMNLKNDIMKLMESYRNSILCFETVEQIARDEPREDQKTENLTIDLLITKRNQRAPEYAKR